LHRCEVELLQQAGVQPLQMAGIQTLQKAGAQPLRKAEVHIFDKTSSLSVQDQLKTQLALRIEQ
jgi:hypothetical protein